MPPPTTPPKVKVKATESPAPDMSDGEASSVHSDDEGMQEKGKGADAHGESSTLPLQKRRRVTRACDECRSKSHCPGLTYAERYADNVAPGKKIKCDGKQPCTHCQVYSYGERNSPLIARRFKGSHANLIPL